MHQLTPLGQDLAYHNHRPSSHHLHLHLVNFLCLMGAVILFAQLEATLFDHLTRLAPSLLSNHRRQRRSNHPHQHSTAELLQLVCQNYSELYLRSLGTTVGSALRSWA